MIKVSILLSDTSIPNIWTQIVTINTSESKLDRIAKKYDTIVRGFNTTLFITGRIDRMHQ